MTHAPSLARLMTLLAVVLLLLTTLRLGSSHPLSECGLIALVLAIVLTLCNCGASPATAAQALYSTLIALLMTALLWRLGLHHVIAQLLPALVQATLSALVARTLLPGRVPVIQRIAATMQPDQQPLPAVLVRHTRYSTWLWSSVFAVLALLHLGVSCWQWPVTTLPLPAGVLDVSVAMLVVVLEHVYRRWRYAGQVPLNLWQFCLRLRQVNPLRLLLQS